MKPQHTRAFGNYTVVEIRAGISLGKANKIGHNVVGRGHSPG